MAFEKVIFVIGRNKFMGSINRLKIQNGLLRNRSQQAV